MYPLLYRGIRNIDLYVTLLSSIYVFYVCNDFNQNNTPHI